MKGRETQLWEALAHIHSLPQLPVGQKDFRKPSSREVPKQKLGGEDQSQLLSLEESPAGN